MGVPKSEKGVVKLVHPGRHVEIHAQPITAAEVMSKNPRHCIARPDVFEYPWIVVRPESILEPGGVFYIVPYRTISDLLKAKKQGDQALTKRNNSDKESHRHFDRCTPLYQQHDRCITNPFKALQVNSRPKSTYMKRSNKQQEPDRKIHAIQGERFIFSELAKPESRDRKKKSTERVIELKSCLRKEGSVRKTRNLKVSFALTTMNRIEAESPIQCVGCTG